MWALFCVVIEKPSCTNIYTTYQANISHEYLGENLIILFAQQHRSSILHEYLDYAQDLA